MNKCHNCGVKITSSNKKERSAMCINCDKELIEKNNEIASKLLMTCIISGAYKIGNLTFIKVKSPDGRDYRYFTDYTLDDESFVIIVQEIIGGEFLDVVIQYENNEKELVYSNGDFRFSSILGEMSRNPKELEDHINLLLNADNEPSLDIEVLRQAHNSIFVEVSINKEINKMKPIDVKKVCVWFLKEDIMEAVET